MMSESRSHLLWERENQSARQKPLLDLPLHSEAGVDYSQLRDLLAAGQWEQADKETKEVMLKAAGRKQECLLDRESVEKFPASDLRTIDQLWVRYSNGRFGFSVQKRIWQDVIEHQNAVETSKQLRLHPKELANQFGERVGWRVQENWLYFRDLTFSLDAPLGHLPSPSVATPCAGRGEEKQAVWERWCVSFCFGVTRCGVLFLGWWSLLEREDL
jgi:hypothetical protein